jgi:hypothetical protein
MERREFRRVHINGNIKGVINQKNKGSIKDMSIGGMCFESSTSLLPGRVHSIELTSNYGTKIMISGVVIRSFLKSIHGGESSSPVYHIGLQFTGKGDEEKKELQRYINSSIVAPIA